MAKRNIWPGLKEWLDTNEGQANEMMTERRAKEMEASAAKSRANELKTENERRAIEKVASAAERRANELKAELETWDKLKIKIGHIATKSRMTFHAGLLFAVAGHLSEADQKPTAGKDLSNGWRKAERGLDEILHYDATRGGPDGEKQSGAVLLEQIFDYWYRIEARPNATVPENPDFAETLIRHLAIIGIPVEAQVLLHCPDVKARLNQAKLTLAQVEDLLAVLCRRGLVFQIEGRAVVSSDSISKPNPSSTSRWGVHRTIQHFVFRRLGEQGIEPADSFLFAPSLFSAQSNRFVQLNARAYAFIYDLVDKLVDYPVHGNLMGMERPKHEEIELYNQRLRAALGVVRTLFSIGIVSRFHDLEGLEVPLPPKLGYFEHHRKVLRWMVRLGGHLYRLLREDLENHDSNIVGDTNRQKLNELMKQHWPPFYRDELVWLYNECAVFSLAQGEMHDAHALFSQAAFLNKSIEGVQTGPNGRRIMLNSARTLADRGHLATAMERLQRLDQACDDDPFMRVLARGEKAVIRGLNGHGEDAVRELEHAVHSCLSTVDWHRPVSLFQRAMGDIYCQLGRFTPSEEAYEAAVRSATAGGAVDLQQAANVARALLAVTQGNSAKANVRSALDEATTYADAMELPRLKADALYVRGEILLTSSEISLAAQFATRALRIATLNGLNLRKNVYAELLARVYMARGDTEAAKVLFARTLKSARSQGHHVLVKKINISLGRIDPRGAAS